MHVPRPQCWGDEAAQKNVYRDAVQNGTARSPAFMHGVCTPNGVASHAWHITAAYTCSPPVTHHHSVHDHTPPRVVPQRHPGAERQETHVAATPGSPLCVTPPAYNRLSVVLSAYMYTIIHDM